MALFDGIQKRRQARQRRRSRRQAARQKRRQTRTAGRFDPDVVLARTQGRQRLVQQGLTAAGNLASSGVIGGRAGELLSGLQGSAVGAYTGDEDLYLDDYAEPAPAGGGLSTPMMIGIGAAVVALVFVMTKK